MNFVTACSSLLVVLTSLGTGVRGGTEETNALLYLSKYGYISNNDGKASQVKEENVKDFIKSAVKDFQAFAGLNETGELDPVTVELMGTPRCGVRDREREREREREAGGEGEERSNYVLQGSRWQTKHLTYRLGELSFYVYWLTIVLSGSSVTRHPAALPTPRWTRP